MTNLAVIGPGLLGASIAMAAKRAGNFRVSIWARRETAVSELQTRGIGDFASTDLRKTSENADLAILCVPIGAMPSLGRQLAAILLPGALVTDVGSVKGSVVAELNAIFTGEVRFVGSHPMAGSEQTGMGFARADLFDDQVCIVTPDPTSQAQDIERVSSFWENLGCRVRQIGPDEHDEIVAMISHFPHLLAAALVDSVCARSPAALDFAGPGFRDTTRVASGPPEMWSEILGVNRLAVKKSAEAMIEKLQEIMTLLDRPYPGGADSMNQFLTSAKTQRDRLQFRA